MKQTFNFLLMLVMVATVLSCAKKTEPTPELTPAQKIIGKYLNTASTSDRNGVVEDNLAGRPSCISDDILEFKTNGTLVTSEGATSCIPANPDKTNTYVLTPDGKTLTLSRTNSSGTTSDVYTVNELTATVLKFGTTTSSTNSAGVVTTRIVIITLTKI